MSEIAKPQRRADAGSLLTRFYSSVLRSARLVKGHTVVVILPVCSNECLKFVIAERMRLIAIAAVLALFKKSCHREIIALYKAGSVCLEDV